jgi:hypothetical protein
MQITSLAQLETILSEAISANGVIPYNEKGNALLDFAELGYWKQFAGQGVFCRIAELETPTCTARFGKHYINVFHHF